LGGFNFLPYSLRFYVGVYHAPILV
jgi:hypothetical protein